MLVDIGVYVEQFSFGPNLMTNLELPNLFLCIWEQMN